MGKPIKFGLWGPILPPELEYFLRDTNPWWQGNPMPPLPPYRRWLFETALQRLKTGLAPITVFRGPRQVGKSTLQAQMIYHLLHQEGIEPQRIFRIQFDEIPALKGFPQPILTLSRWFERQILQSTFNQQAHQGKPVFLFFDEVQQLADWAPQVKALVDHHAVRVLLTGSSALRIEHGRDSLAGRITTLELGPLLLREIAGLAGIGQLPPLLPENDFHLLKERSFWEEIREHGRKHRQVRDQAFLLFSERGGYPMAQARPDRPWQEVAAQLNETVIQRVIQHDLRLGEKGRKRDANLLEELFRICCRYAGQAPGQAVFVQELRTALGANVGPNRVLDYLRFLSQTLLIRLVQPLELRLKRRKGPPKICLCDHSLRASWLQEKVPLVPEQLHQSPDLADLAGRLAESILGYFLGTIPGLELAWFPERTLEPEVDFVITIGEHRIPVEIKYRRRIDEHRDTLGLRAFLEKTVYRAPFGLLITGEDDVVTADPRIICLPLASLLLMR